VPVSRSVNTLIEKKHFITQIKRPHYPIWVIYPRLGIGVLYNRLLASAHSTRETNFSVLVNIAVVWYVWGYITDKFSDAFEIIN